LVVGAYHYIPAVFAADHRAAGPGYTLVAGAIADIPEIGAPGALQEVAAHGRLVAHLWACRVQQSFGDHGILLDPPRVFGYLGHRGRGAEPQALRSNLDAIVQQPREADEPLVPARLFFQNLQRM